MSASFTIRLATAADYESIAALVVRTPAAELCDFEHSTVVDLHVFDQSMAAAHAPVTRWVALDQAGCVQGAAFTFLVPWTTRPQHYWSGVRVDPLARRQGLGQALYHQMTSHIARVGGQSLAIETRAAAEGVLIRNDTVDLREAYRSTEWRVNLNTLAIQNVSLFREQLQAQNIVIWTLPELQQADPDWLPKLHQLYITLARDVPIPERATISMEQLAEFVGDLPISLPSACFVATDAGCYIGVSFMHRDLNQPLLYQKLTGVLADHRGRGIALALKLATLAYAQAQGFEQISTWIESNNPAMLHLSRKLGFIEQPHEIMVLEARL